MNSEKELQLTKANSEIASIVSQWSLERSRKAGKGSVAMIAKLQDRSPAIMNPAGFWAAVLADSGNVKISDVEIEQSVKLAAAKIKTGDISFVVESALGQIAWLSALAIEFKQDADNQPAESTSRIRLLNLSLRAQGAAAKLMISVAAIPT